MSDKHCPLLFSHHHYHHSAFVKNDPRSKKATTEDCNLEHSCHPRPAQFHYFPWWAFYNFTICNKTNLDPNLGHWHEYGSKMEKIHAFFDTLSTVFHRWKFLAMWNAVFRGRGAVSRCFSRVFHEELLWEDDDGWSNQETKAVSPLCAFCNMDNWKFRGKSGNRWEMLASQGVLRAI